MLNAFLRFPKPEVIVSGMPKAGTTAILELLGALCEMDTCNDPFYKMDCAKIDFRSDLFSDKVSLFQLVKNNKKFFKGQILKDPNFPLLYDQLRKIFPQASFVHLVRHPADNIRSILDRLQISGEGTDDEILTSGLQGTWLNVLMGNSPDISGRDYIERLAHRWCKSVAEIPKHEQRDVVIRYEDFVAAKKEVLNDVSLKLGLLPVAEIDSLLDVQYQPKGVKGRVSPVEFFSRQSLEKILDITDGFRQEFGYE